MTTGVILGPDHPWRSEVERTADVAWDGDASGLVAAARIPLDILAVDLALLRDGGVEHLTAYRIARPGTRVIVHTGDAAPGDRTAAALVSIGVFDLTKEPWPRALAERLTFADAARWRIHYAVGVTTGRRRGGSADAVAPLRPVGPNRPLLAIVAGAGYGVGTTTLAQAFAETARALGHKTVVLDCAVMPGASRIPSLNAVRVPPLGGRALAAADVMEETRRAGHGWVVVDAGSVGDPGLEDILPYADIVLVAISPDPHRLGWLEALSESLPGRAHLFAVGGSEADAAVVGGVAEEAVGCRASRLDPDDPAPAIRRAAGSLLGGEEISGRARPRRGSMRLVVRLPTSFATGAAQVLGRASGVIVAAALLALVVVVVVPALSGVHGLTRIADALKDASQSLEALFP